MWCQHHNGSWIAFPLAASKEEVRTETPSKEEVSASKEES